MIGRALAFAVSRGYPTKETISFIIGQAGREEIAISKVIESKQASPAAETPASPEAQLNATEVK